MTLGLTSYQITCGLRSDTKDVIRGKKSFVFLDSGQLYLVTVNYEIYFTVAVNIIHRGSCEEAVQVNGAFHGIEKTCVIIHNYSTLFFIYFLQVVGTK